MQPSRGEGSKKTMLPVKFKNATFQYPPSHTNQLVPVAIARNQAVHIIMVDCCSVEGLAALQASSQIACPLNRGVLS